MTSVSLSDSVRAGVLEVSLQCGVRILSRPGTPWPLRQAYKRWAMGMGVTSLARLLLLSMSFTGDSQNGPQPCLETSRGRRGEVS